MSSLNINLFNLISSWARIFRFCQIHIKCMVSRGLISWSAIGLVDNLLFLQMRSMRIIQQLPHPDFRSRYPVLVE